MENVGFPENHLWDYVSFGFNCPIHLLGTLVPQQVFLWIDFLYFIDLFGRDHSLSLYRSNCLVKVLC